MAYKPSKRKKHNTKPRLAKLNLNSMMDMFTIILLFLLKTYSAHGQLLSPSPLLQLPESKIRTQPEVGLELIVAKNAIFIGDEKVVEMDLVRSNRSGIVANNVIRPLLLRLYDYQNEAKALESDYGVKFSGIITIQADRDVKYKEIVKVLRTCRETEFDQLRLIVYRKNENS